MHELLEKYKLNPRKISYCRSIKIIDTDKGKYTVKLRNSPNRLTYQYLDNHNFDYYLKQINDYDDPYEIYPYINENIDKETKAINLMYIMSILHNKTTIYQEINLDEVKEKYEDITNRINYLSSYYYDLQDYIENIVYMSPAFYLLIRNINIIYASLNSCRNNIDKWYQLKLKQRKERIVFLHNNISLDHFLINKDSYLINWKDASKGSPVYDFLNFYKKEYKNIEMENLFKMYQSKFKYTEDERYLFNALIELPWKLDFKNSNYLNTLEVGNLLSYLAKSNNLVLKEYEKDEKAQEEKLN